jgi:D-alanyl-D-alanine carboxypeptidase
MMNRQHSVPDISPDLIQSRNLCAYAEATDLERVEIGEDGRDHLLIPAAARAWRELKAAALADNVIVSIGSAFRSVERQIAIVQQKLDTGMPIEDVLKICAPPGYSEHHSGRAVDVATSGHRLLDAQFAQTDAYAWLNKNAGRFGFFLSYPPGNRQGFMYEPWHWCYQQTTLADEAANRTAS